MTYTLELRGSVPCKKNRWHRGKGGMYFDEPEAKRGNIQALIDALILQSRTQWNGQAVRPIERTELISAVFTVKDGRSDLDGKWTTLQDILVKAGVLRNDSIARVPHTEQQALIRPDEEESVSVMIWEAVLTGRER